MTERGPHFEEELLALSTRSFAQVTGEIADRRNQAIGDYFREQGIYVENALLEPNSDVAELWHSTANKAIEDEAALTAEVLEWDKDPAKRNTELNVLGPGHAVYRRMNYDDDGNSVSIDYQRYMIQNGRVMRIDSLASTATAEPRTTLPPVRGRLFTSVPLSESQSLVRDLKVANAMISERMYQGKK